MNSKGKGIITAVIVVLIALAAFCGFGYISQRMTASEGITYLDKKEYQKAYEQFDHAAGKFTLIFTKQKKDVLFYEGEALYQMGEYGKASLKQEQIDMTDENLELHSGNLGTAVRDLSELIIHKELIEDIMEIVSLYKQEWQEIFYMKCFEERTFQDISQTLNISENTVKSRFYKMIRQIKSEVDYQ